MDARSFKPDGLFHLNVQRAHPVTLETGPCNRRVRGVGFNQWLACMVFGEIVKAMIRGRNVQARPAALQLPGMVLRFQPVDAAGLSIDGDYQMIAFKGQKVRRSSGSAGRRDIDREPRCAGRQRRAQEFAAR